MKDIGAFLITYAGCVIATVFGLFIIECLTGMLGFGGAVALLSAGLCGLVWAFLRDSEFGPKQ